MNADTSPHRVASNYSIDKRRWRKKAVVHARLGLSPSCAARYNRRYPRKKSCQFFLSVPPRLSVCVRRLHAARVTTPSAAELRGWLAGLAGIHEATHKCRGLCFNCDVCSLALYKRLSTRARPTFRATFSFFRFLPPPTPLAETATFCQPARAYFNQAPSPSLLPPPPSSRGSLQFRRR